MTYLNQGLIFGAAAFAIPLIIHILNRSRFKTVEWGAMHLLDSVIKVNHKRFRIDQLILLLVRCAIPILLAFCLARPVLTGAQALEGETPVSLVIVLDNSYSMETLEASNSRFESAVSAAAELIESSPRGTDFSIVFTGEKPSTLFEESIFDAGAVVRKLKATQAGFGASDMSASLNEALAISSGMSHPRREIIVLSDFQSADWTKAETSPSDVIQQQLSSMELPPALTFIQIGKPLTANVSIDSLDYPNRVLGTGQRLDIRVNVRNHGIENIDTLRIIMKIDGKEESVSQVGLAGNSSSQALFPVTFKTAGSHVVEFEVMANDDLKADNKLSAAFSVWESLPVLLVDGAPSREPLQSETDFLAVALTPFTFGRLTLADLIESKTVTTNELKAEILEEIKVVVLANVNKLTDQQLDTLKTFVETGGALFVCAGNKVDLNWSREKFFADGKGLLPFPYLTLKGNQDGSESSQIVAQHFEHPALDYFNNSQHGDLSSAEIQRWYSLEEPSNLDSNNSPKDDEAPNAAPVVIARLSTGDPLLVEKTYGDGVVLQFATTCDAEWNDLPMKPIYVPLMQQLVTYLASRNIPPQNIASGAPAVALLGSEKTPETLSVSTPDATTQLAQTFVQGRLNYAQFEQTLRPGVYRMSLPSEQAFHFVSSTSRDESNPQIIESTKLKDVAESSGATMLESAREYLKQDRLRRNGREIWKYVLAGLLTLMFLELVLQQRFSRVRI